MPRDRHEMKKHKHHRKKDLHKKRDDNDRRDKRSKKVEEKHYSDSSSSNEWEEKVCSFQKGDKIKREEWMNTESLVPASVREKIIRKPKDENRCIIAKPGQSDRELNPYWKDGGTGLPTIEKDLSITSTSVGDAGQNWYEKALQRAEETAAAENRPLEDVVRERWESLDKLKSLIAESKKQDFRKSRYQEKTERSRPSFRRPVRDFEETSRSHHDNRESDKWKHSDIRSDRPKPSFKRPHEDYDIQYGGSQPEQKRGGWKKRDAKKDEKSQNEETSQFHHDNREYEKWKHSDFRSDRPKPSFKRPHEDYDSKYIDSHPEQKRGGWKKRVAKKDEESQNDLKVNLTKTSLQEIKEESFFQNKQHIEDATHEQSQKKTEILSDEQLNALAAKLVKAEIMGNASLVDKLKSRISEARIAREKSSTDPSNKSEEIVILTTTNEKGLTRPVQGPSLVEPKGGRRKAQKADTHSGGQRVRYFYDDDKRDLKEMFEQERLASADDDKELFLKLSAKKSKYAGSDEEDAAFADAARMKESDGKIQKRERSRAIHEESKRRKALDGCVWCIDNPQRLKHLIVSIGETCYLCLPAEESLSPMHCLIVPIQHVTCGTLLDENVWDEIHKFKKALVAMAESMDQDVIIFEQARAFRSNPHMVLQCVIIEKEIGDLAPIYFKKAILESESEWASNKKVVDIKGVDVRGSIPKGLPYFSVQFGSSNGYAHVIEDEKEFPKNFAQSIVGGMLDLDHTTWRKARKTTVPAQMQKTSAFSKVWSKFDFTSSKKRRHSSSGSDSLSSTSSTSTSSDSS